MTGLTISAIASPVATTTATAALAGLIAVLAVHGTIAAGLEWNCGLLSAPGAGHRCTRRRTALISTATAAARLFRFPGLTACFTALRRRITTFTEELLILARKREYLPAIAAGELLISSHRFLSSMLQVCAAF